MPPFQKPYLPEGFLTWDEPPDESGDEVFRIVSWRRSLTLKGHSFREFSRSVLPLLDGRRSFEEICAATADIFSPADLEAALSMLGAEGIIVEGALIDVDVPLRLTPQVNYLGEIAYDGRNAQRRLTSARVVIFGMGGAGAALARNLAASGIGRLVCIDPYLVRPADSYFSALIEPGQTGTTNRAEAVVTQLRRIAPEIVIEDVCERIDEVEAIANVINGADLVISCLDAGDLNWNLKLNRAARTLGLRWLTGAMEGAEIVAGPGFPADGEGPCFMCYRMREVACTANPQSRFGLERRLDRLRQDLSGRRENLACGADLLAGLLGAEAINLLGAISEPALDGRIIVSDLTTLRQEKHAVLRKPDCPVCSKGAHA
jgi:adenylyltransferase/sulfurtransferase